MRVYFLKLCKSEKIGIWRIDVVAIEMWRMQESKRIPECFNGCLFTII